MLDDLEFRRLKFIAREIIEGWSLMSWCEYQHGGLLGRALSTSDFGPPKTCAVCGELDCARGRTAHNHSVRPRESFSYSRTGSGLRFHRQHGG